MIQSFIYTISHVRLSTYENRIMLKIIEHAQVRLESIKLSDNICKLDHDFDNVKITIPIAEILSEGNTHYNEVREAAKSLMSRQFEYYESETGTWFATPIIYNLRSTRKSGMLTFYVARKIFDIILDFSKGYRMYEMQTAMKLPTASSARMYTLVNKQTKPMTYRIETLKKIFGVEDKYKQTGDFIKKVIAPAQRILDEEGCTSFDYRPVKERQKIIALLITPKAAKPKKNKENDALLASIEAQAKAVTIHLMTSAGFSMRECKAHAELIREFCQLDNVPTRLQKILARWQRLHRGKGYIVNALRSEVSENGLQE